VHPKAQAARPALRGEEGAECAGSPGEAEARRREWEWDQTLFAGAAAYYDRGRLPNAPGLTDAFENAFGLDGRGRLLDIGCGPGTVTLPLAGLFQEVVGLDADTGMIQEARRLASERGVMNARWVERRAEELPADLGRFNVVTFAASFHWMDRPVVARIVRGMGVDI
jgi:ubiquinone/menaquinone biosynthesis C-methylase UbiE